jgi:uncharacterized membrane protein
MGQWVETFKWDFPGGVWGIIILLAATLVLITVSYIFTMRKVSGGAKISLIILRLLFISLIIFCLCRPRIERQRSMEKSTSKKIAVLVDVSDSMRTKGFWKKDRLDEALEFWRQKVKKGDKTFKYEFYTFAEQIDKIDNLNSAPVPKNSKKLSTKFFKAIIESCDKFYSNNFDGVIYLTDAIDTSGEEVTKTTARLSESPIKHIFVPMETKLPSKPFINIRKLEAPAQAFVGTEVPILLITQQAKITPQTDIRIIISKNSQQPFANHRLRGGNGIQTIKIRLPIRKPGLDTYKAVLQVNGKTHSEVIWSITKTIKKESAKVLVYQGALDWGTRFLRYVFADSDKIKMVLRYAPDVYKLSSPAVSTNFPDSTELSKFDVVVLFNLNRSQITPQMERDLKKFVSCGGGLLFLNGNPVSVKEFANSPLENLLPVRFYSKFQTSSRSDPTTEQFLQRISRNRNGTRWDTNFRRSKEFTFKVPELKKFTLSNIGKQSPIFKYRTTSNKERKIVPEFQDMAWVKEAKPGANILAYFKPSNGKKNILLAYQNFGLGRSMVMATDPLWRWRMNTFSSDKSFEYFWKNLLFWLAQGKDVTSSWQIPNLYIQAGKELRIYFKPGKEIYDISKLKCFAKNNKTQNEEILKLYRDSFTPEQFYIKINPLPAYKYHLQAEYEKKTVAECTFLAQVKKTTRMEEMLLKPDLKVLQDFAVLDNVYIESATEGFNIEKYFTTKTFTLTEKESSPLWHHWWLYVLLITFIAAELIIRRFFKLV